MGNAANIVVGAATVLVDGTDVGYTSGGVRLGVVKDIWTRPSMSGLGSEEAVLLDSKYIISTYFAEPTIDNLIIAWGMVTSDAAGGDHDKKYFGGGSDITYHTLEIQGKAPGTDKDRVIHFYRVCSVEFGEMMLQKGRESVVPVTFEALLDTDKNRKAQMGYLRDET